MRRPRIARLILLLIAFAVVYHRLGLAGLAIRLVGSMPG